MRVTKQQLITALEDLTKEINLKKVNVKKDYSLMVAHAQATKLLFNIKK